MRISRLFGASLVLLGLVVNVWTLERFVVMDGDIESRVWRWLITAAGAGVIGAGLWLWKRAPAFTAPTRGELLTLTASTVLALGLGEAGARVMQPPGTAAIARAYAGELTNRPGTNFIADADTGWRMLAGRTFSWTTEGTTNVYRSNGQGFRSDREFVPAKSAVGLAGDSFAWGLGVDDAQTFGTLLEARLDGGGVYNFGMPGFGLDQMWLSVRHQMLPLEPALVIVAFIDNDFSRSLTAYRPDEGFNKPRFVLDGGALRPEAPSDRPAGIWRALERHSALWRLLTSARERIRPLSEWWALNTAILDAIAADCRAAKVPVLFVRLPQFERRHFPALTRRMSDDGLNYLDLETSATPDDLHLKEDRHLNAKGHAFVAGAIAEWISAHRVPVRTR